MDRIAATRKGIAIKKPLLRVNEANIPNAIAILILFFSRKKNAPRVRAMNNASLKIDERKIAPPQKD